MSRPEPDSVLLANHRHEFAARKPKASEKLLAVEIAESSLHVDLKFRAGIYARAGIAAG